MTTQEQTRDFNRQSFSKLRIAVLAMQGDYARHLAVVSRLGAEASPARLPQDLTHANGIILPGGESTTIGKLMARYGMDQALQEAAAAGVPIYGTCAGLILLAREIAEGTSERGGQPILGLLDVTVARNAFGRQTDSFETFLDVPVIGDPPVRAVFIRAPAITRVGPGVETLAVHQDKIVLVRTESLLGSAFHPELTDDERVHRLFLTMARDRIKAQA